MSEQELRDMQEALRKQLLEVSTSKAAARKLLLELDIITPKGNLRKSFKPAKVSK